MNPALTTCLAAFTLVTPALGQNLVVNGGFESGGTGWTTWQSPWGNGNSWDFNNAESGRVGNACLKLGIGGERSFGVYQEVAVTPGHTYRIDAWWKGQRFGNDSWVEIMLLDGPYSDAQADSGGAGVVQPNFMYAHDPLGGDFGWKWAHDDNGTSVDWNSRNGERTATGSVMTVVLKAGCCCGTTAVNGWFDEVSLVDTAGGGGGGGGNCNSLVNGAFNSGSTGWTAWFQHNTGGDFSATVSGGEMNVTGSDFNGGVYQQFDTGGAGTVVNVLGEWRSNPTLANAMWGEVLVINADRVPVNGVDETDGVNNAILLYKNDTFAGRGAWDDVMPKSAPVKNTVSFTAAAAQATLILKSGNTGSGQTGVSFDNVSLHCVPAPATLAALPAGFALRTHTFPVTAMVSTAQSPVSRLIYAVENKSGDALYRVNTSGGSITSTFIADIGFVGVFRGGAQGLAFDPAGNIYISSQLGDVVKGTETNPDPNVDTFSFAQIVNMSEPTIGTFHGVGGLAVGPDDKLYINSGSATHYGPEADVGFNMRIVRCNLDGTGMTSFCEGIRNSFDITFRAADGTLWGVENGPNASASNNCAYAEEFNKLQEGLHYGFPYRFGSDLNGSDNSITCTSDSPNVGPQPGGPGNMQGAWANYGPNAKPVPGQGGDLDGLDDVFYGFHPHSSPDGVDFYEPALMDPSAIKFPAAYHGRAFVARFGHLEASVTDVGRDVLSLQLDEVHDGFFCNTFLGSMGRAIDVLCAYNGALYVLEYNPSTSGNGLGSGNSRIHEITYTIPGGPLINLSPASIARAADVGTNLPDDSFDVCNVGDGTMNYAITDDAAWLSVAPTAGATSGPCQPHTISYNVAGLDCGVHVATISVTSAEAANSPQTLQVTVTIQSVKGDYDCDGDVDPSDYGILQACYSGPGIAAAPGCEPARLDGDNDVDVDDLNAFLDCFSGEGVAANVTCDDGLE